MIHVYYGDGKGKTTAALGLTLRAHGGSLRCVVVQFLKDWNVGELEALKILGIPALRGIAEGPSFSNEMSEAEKEKTRKIHEWNLRIAFQWGIEGNRDFIVLDEALDALNLNLLGEEPLRQYLDEQREKLEIVITGHQPVDWIMERADYVTEMVKHVHPFDRGITARKGVEF